MIQKTNKKRSNFLLFSMLFIFLFILTIKTAFADPFRPFLHNPTIPEQKELKLESSSGTNLYYGAAIYIYPIKVPPGVNELQPKIKLIYNSHQTRQIPDILGTGWTLTQNYIQRDINYTNNLFTDDKFKLVLNGDVYDIVYVPSEDRYHTKIETYMHIQNQTGGNNEKSGYWIVKTKDGTIYRFGFENSSELVSNLNSSIVSRWSLDLINDTHNNSIVYTHQENPYQDDNGVVYLSKIEYNNDQKRSIDFVYESSNRPDLWMVYKEGNKIKQSRRLNVISISANGNLIRRYYINYSTINSQTRRSISTITEYGDDNTTALPSINFVYNNVTKGWIEDDSWEMPTSDTCFVDENGLDNGIRLVDINRDGLVDVLLGNAGAGACNDDQRKTWINNGTGWSEDDSWEMPTSDTCFVDSTGENEGIRLTDVNGDGLVEVLFGKKYGSGNCNNNDRRTWINKATKTYLLKNITNNMGGIISIDYKNSISLNNIGNDSISDLGFNIWVVKSLNQQDGMNGSHNISSLIVYNYSGGFYDHENQEFRGFVYTEENKSIGIKIQHWFHQDNIKNGKEYKTEIYNDQGNAYEKIEYNWNSNQSNSYHIIALNSKTVYTYDGAFTNPKITNTTYSYDSYGNINKTSFLGDISINGDEYYNYTKYLNNTATWIINKLKIQYIYGFDDSTKFKETKYSYDNQAYETAPTKGDLTKIEEWLSTGTNPITTYGYDVYGNLANQTNPRGYTTTFQYGIRDSTYTFPEKIINAKGQIIENYYDLGTGKLLSITDSNGYVTNYTYDAHGRILKEIMQYDTLTYPTKEYNYTYDGVAPEKILIKQRETSGQTGTFDTYQFYDGFGNLIQIKTEAENNQQIVLDIFYDEEGKIEKQSNPYFISFTSSYSIPDQLINYTKIFYDTLQRPVNITNSDGTKKSIIYAHWNHTFIDENANPKSIILNAFGRINKMYEYLSNNVYETIYGYDALGNLINITDDQGNQFNYIYNTLNRKISQTDPDSGTWNYIYDGNGNIISQIDNKNIITSMSYDELDRMILKNTSTQNILYIYDTNKNGTLYQVQYGLITTNYTYDNRLRLTQQEVSIDGNSFITSWTYDAMDRTLTEIQPNNIQIYYTYNNQGLLETIAGVITAIDYNPSGLLYNRTYSNSLISRFNYNPESMRLSKIETSNKQNLSYFYDSVGNIIKNDDSVNNKSNTMAYDYLNRLREANRTNDYVFNYSYDNIGNLLIIDSQNKSINFTYGPTPAHSPIKVSSS